MRATASALLLSLIYTAPAAAQVSATASPVSNSSGSVVNQAVQITPGQYMKHSYGSAIQCDSATLNISPFVSSTHSFGNPDNQYYQEPVYDNSDNFGLIDPETGLDGPDGIPDNPGKVLYYKPQRTGYRQNYSNNFGITATFSVPLDWGQSILASRRRRNRSRSTSNPWLTSGLTTRWAGSKHVLKPCVKATALSKIRRSSLSALMLS